MLEVVCVVKYYIVSDKFTYHDLCVTIHATLFMTQGPCCGISKHANTFFVILNLNREWDLVFCIVRLKSVGDMT